MLSQCFPGALLESQAIFQTVLELCEIRTIANDKWLGSTIPIPVVGFPFYTHFFLPLVSVQQQHNDQECMHNAPQIPFLTLSSIIALIFCISKRVLKMRSRNVLAKRALKMRSQNALSECALETRS